MREKARPRGPSTTGGASDPIALVLLRRLEMPIYLSEGGQQSTMPGENKASMRFLTYVALANE